MVVMSVVVGWFIIVDPNLNAEREADVRDDVVDTPLRLAE